MITIIGSTTNCARCTMIKNTLDAKGVAYTFKDVKELSKEYLNTLLKYAEEKGIKSLPLILADDKELKTIQEVLRNVN